MKTFILFAFLLLNCILSDAKITVKGTVTGSADKQPIPGVSVTLKGSQKGTITDLNGYYQQEVDNATNILVFSFIGYTKKEIAVGAQTRIDVVLEEEHISLDEVVVVGYGVQRKSMVTGAISSISSNSASVSSEREGTESYAHLNENGYKKASKDAFSTFSVDVDAASYTNFRRFINGGTLPPSDAIRVEEMINYFHYDYKQPKNKDPFSVDYQLSECPWNKDKKLLHIGLQGKIIPLQNLAPSNLVFLIDVSGSMNEPNKLPLLISAFKLLTEQLRKKDRVSIVVYAGNTGVVLPSTEGNRKAEIFAALDKLQAGGSTAGGAGLQLAYKIAEENFIENGNNRIVLATDGDFNVGASSNEAMENMIVGYRDKKIYISVLGFGMGNYKDDKMELIADKGNGNYAYIDNLQEAKRTLVTQFAGTLYTIAKDVKIQVEFNPSVVDSFRLIGYEDRMLSKEDFKDDKKDAGEIGSGHTVTALYEITPTKKRSQLPHSLKYRNSALNENNKNMVTI